MFYIAKMILDSKEILIWSRPYDTDAAAIKATKRMGKNRAEWSGANIVKLDILVRCDFQPHSEQLRDIEEFSKGRELYTIINNT